MAYKGKTISVSCAKGGFTGSKNIDDIPNYMMVDPTRNIVFERGGRRKRGGSAHLYAGAYSGTPSILGLKYVTFEDTSAFLMAATSDGDIYSGESNSLNAAVKASGTVTTNGTNVSDADTVTIGSTVYTFKTILTPLEGEVLIGASAAVSLDNLKLAVNRTDPTTNDGVKYKIAAAHTTVEATTNSDTVQTFDARTAGTAGNSIALAKSAATLTVSAATLLGGLAKVSLGTTFPYSMEMGENKVFIADGVNVPHAWTGSGRTAAISEPSADFTTYPVFQFLKHTRGLSERMCALNSRGLFMSKSYAAAGDMEKFITDALYFHIDPGDGLGMKGMIEMGSEVVLFSKRKAYRLDDTDLDTSNWGLNGAQWSGGVSSWRLLVKLPNGDVLAMMDDGDIYSVSAAESYGDYKLASVTRPSWMFDWIKANVDLSKISTFHSRFDNELRAVRWFVAKNGETTPDTCLLYYVDREPAEAWMIEDNPVAVSGYNAISCCDAPSTTGGYVFYTGDNAGNIWKLNQVNRNDNALGYPAGFKTAMDSFGAPEITKMFNSGAAILEAKGDWDLQLRAYVDNSLINKEISINLAGGGVMLGTFVLGTDTLGDSTVIDIPFGIGKVGKRIQYDIYNNNANEDFFISGYSTDFKPMGRPSQGGDQ